MRIEMDFCTLWHILSCIEACDLKPNKNGIVEVEMDFHIPLGISLNEKSEKSFNATSRKNLLTILQDFLWQGVIVKGKGTLRSFDQEKGDFIIIEEKILTTETFFPEDENGEMDYIPLFTAENLNSAKDLDFLLEIDLKKAEEKVLEHFTYWKENSLALSYKKLKPELQVKKVVESIFQNLKEYPENNLFLETMEEDISIYFYSTVLFLDFIGAIKMKGFYGYRGEGEEYSAIIKILPKFYEDFKVGQDGTIQFDFENLIPIEERKKRIYYKSPTELEQNGTIYEMKKNTFPFFLFSLLQQSKEKKVTFEDIEKAFGGVGKQMGGNMPKDLRNLRGGLKKRFEIEGEENLLFVLEGNTISLQKEMFAF
jgi:hypothetical protein